MQLSTITLVAFVATAMAASRGSPLHARLAPRQNSNVDVAAAAMTDANGNVVPFDHSNVFKDAVAKGQ